MCRVGSDQPSGALQGAGSSPSAPYLLRCCISLLSARASYPDGKNSIEAFLFLRLKKSDPGDHDLKDTLAEIPNIRKTAASITSRDQISHLHKTGNQKSKTDAYSLQICFVWTIHPTSTPTDVQTLYRIISLLPTSHHETEGREPRIASTKSNKGK